MSQQTANLLAACEAILNTASAVLLIVGYVMIRRRRITAHKRCMLAALVCSIAFIALYLTLHYAIGTTRFPDLGWIRHTYLGILLTHTILAALVPFLVAVTLYLAFRSKFARHKSIARWTLPIWLYVSVTGVVIYFFLYHLAPAMAGR